MNLQSKYVYTEYYSFPKDLLPLDTISVMYILCFVRKHVLLRPTGTWQILHLKGEIQLTINLSTSTLRYIVTTGNIYMGGIIILRPGVFVQKPLACVIIPSNPIYTHVLAEKNCW